VNLLDLLLKIYQVILIKTGGMMALKFNDEYSENEETWNNRSTRMV